MARVEAEESDGRRIWKQSGQDSLMDRILASPTRVML